MDIEALEIVHMLTCVVSGHGSTPEKTKNAEVEAEEVIEVLEDEEEDYIEEPTEVSGAKQVKQIVDGTGVDSEKERKRKESLEKLEEVARAIQEAMQNPQASQRRAQFAASGSTSGSGPRMKIARKSRY